MTRHVVCPNRLLGISTPGNSQLAKLLFAALVCWMKELLLITDCVLYLNSCNLAVPYIVYVEKRAMSSSVLYDHYNNTRSVLAGGAEVGSRYKLPGPSGPEGARGPTTLPTFLSVSVRSDVIRK